MEKESFRMLNIAFIETVDIILDTYVHVIVFCETWYSLIVVDGAYIEKSQVYFKFSEGVKNYYHRPFWFFYSPKLYRKYDLCVPRNETL
jgi:hypothetical protein